MSEKWVFIVNPIAGNGFAKTNSSKVKEMIDKNGIDAELVFTEREGHATELAEEYFAKGFKYFICVGGDGTLNEIARSIVNHKEAVIGIIPSGTGNDYIPVLGFPERFTDNDWKIFFEKNLIRADVGSVNGNIFINGMGLGFDAEVAAENYVEPGQIKMGSKNKYIWHIVKTLLFFKERKMKIINDGEVEETNCFINTVSIGRRFAGGFFLTPEAIANDGLLDVCSIKALNLFQRFVMLPKVPKGTHIKDDKVNYYRTKKITLEFEKEVPFHCDGELGYGAKLEVEVLPAALNIIYNPNGSHYFS